MSKGNLFMSQGRGKVGSVVFSVLKGQQIARVYNPKPANPRSSGQQAQRALLANMTKFYKRATSNFYRFAYENKSVRESDYNAFARENTSRGVYMPRMFYESAFAPALGRYIVSRGSLAVNIKDFFSGDSYGVAVPGTTDITTIGALSSALLSQSPNMIEGDIFTMVMADSSMEYTTISGDDTPTWQIIQFFIDPSDLRPLSEIGLTDLTTSASSAIVPGRFVGLSISGIDRASFGATVISRQTENGLLVSTAEVKLSAVGNVLTDWFRGEFMRRETAVSWGANPDAILQGALVKVLPDVTSIRYGNATSVPAYTSATGILQFGGTSAGTITLEGSYLKTTAQGGKYVVKVYDARLLSDGLATAPVVSFPINVTTAGDSVSLRLPAIPNSSPLYGMNQGYVLVEVDDVPVSYAQIVFTQGA